MTTPSALCATLVLAGLLLGASIEGEAALSPRRQALRCRSAAARSVQLMTRVGLQLVDRCLRDNGPLPPPECGTLDTTTGTPFGRARTRAGAKLTELCQRPEGNPAQANFPGGDSTTIVEETTSLLDQIAQEMLRGAVAAGETANRAGSSSRRCVTAVSDQGADVVTAVLDASTACQRGRDRRAGEFGPIDAGCLTTGGGTPARANTVIARRCDDPAGQAFAAATCAPFPACQTDASVLLGQQLASTAYYIEPKVVEPCGNGLLETNERCDDGNRIDTDGCTNGCDVAYCGDGIVQDGVEACDDGLPRVDDDCCSNSCVPAVCGDGVVQAACSEDCEDGVDPNCSMCKFVPVVCDGSGLVATVSVRWDLPTPPPPPVSGVEFFLDYPSSLTMPVIRPEVPIVPTSRVRSLVPGASVGAAVVDANGDGKLDVKVLFGISGDPFPPGDIIALQFDCPAGAELLPRDLTCGLISASNEFGTPIGSTILGQIPCVISRTENTSASTR